MKALLITDCDDSKKWYSELVGCVVPFAGDEGNEFRSREPAGYINYVSKTDCVTIEGSSVAYMENYKPIV